MVANASSLSNNGLCRKCILIGSFKPFLIITSHLARLLCNHMTPARTVACCCTSSDLWLNKTACIRFPHSLWTGCSSPVGSSRAGKPYATASTPRTRSKQESRARGERAVAWRASRRVWRSRRLGQFGCRSGFLWLSMRTLPQFGRHFDHCRGILQPRGKRSWTHPVYETHEKEKYNFEKCHQRAHLNLNLPRKHF